MRVLIVDDHPIARRGLATVVSSALHPEAIDEADAPAAALALARRHQPNLVLTDMHMPGSVPARELCAQLRAVLPRSPIVLVTAYERGAEIRDCLQAGATGCLLKDASEVDLAGSLRTIVSGRAVIDPRAAQQMALDMAESSISASPVRLTVREREVLSCLAEGRSNRQIADRLIISEATAKGHVSSLLEKLGAASRLQAVVRAGQAGLL
jgi:DNA-binding NarL/FixJ family response regulator